MKRTYKRDAAGRFATLGQTWKRDKDRARTIAYLVIACAYFWALAIHFAAWYAVSLI